MYLEGDVMKKLSELYKGYPDIPIKSIKINSKQVEEGDIFVCVMGVNEDRHNYIDEAISNGASAIVVSRDVTASVPVIKVENTNLELSLLASRFYNHPENYLDIIGTTGTNGKTTVASIIQDLIGNDICGYLGTNGIICSKFNESIRNTTPDSDRLYDYFRRFVDSGCKMLSMEVSSEAFYRDRVSNLKFKIGIITNITEDHLNVHKTIENYVLCKKKLVEQVRDDGFSILNIDDKYYDEVRKVAKGTVLTYGKKDSTLQIVNVKQSLINSIITFKYQDNLYEVNSPLLGEFNAYNLAAAILALLANGYKIEDVISRVANIKVPSGRVQNLDYGQNYHIILDYAHTTDAFINLFNLINKVKTSKVITITGSAGGREKEKRPLMGKVVLDNSDYVIFTMDDPRYEDPRKIISDLVSASNKNNYEIIIDRKEAIYKALSIAEKDDIILVAGKGIDNYMAIEDKYLPYSDLKVIDSYFRKED